MNKLQKYFELRIFIDYKVKLVFDAKKSFFCLGQPNLTQQHKCLGAGKGRKYAEIDKISIDYLEKFYFEPNVKLKAILMRNGYEIPTWLEDISVKNI
jgi:hypothetical protein